jgi:disulfide bond formation protein DsbB
MNSVPADRVWLLLFGAWLVALAATAGALFIGEVMGQAPCVLCWYQRAFMFPLAVILAVATFRSDLDAWRYGLPLAAIGWLIAGYHVLLYFEFLPKSIEPCGAGPSCADSNMAILGSIPIPLLSLGSFTFIMAMLLMARRR